MRGLLHAKRARHSQAIVDFDAALASPARKSLTLFLARGKSYEILGDREKALADFESAKAVSPIGPIEVSLQLEATAKVASFKKSTPAVGCRKQPGDQCL